MVAMVETPMEPVANEEVAASVPEGAVPEGAVPEAPVPEANAQPKRIKRLERPKKAELDEEVNQRLEQVDKLQIRIHEIKGLLDSRQQNKHVASAEVQDARGRLNEITASFRMVMDEKRALREELEQADKLRERMRADVRALRDKLPYVRVEQIDEEIKKLEYQMTHTSLTLQKEKQLLQQVKDLTKSRDFVKDYSERQEQINQDESSRGEVLGKIREKDSLLNDLRTQQDEQRKELAEIREKDATQAVDIPTLLEERNGAFEKIRSLRGEVKELRAEFRGREEEYWERERQWREQEAVRRRKDFEKREADRKERDKIRQQRALENYVEPYTDEIIMVNQLSSYLEKFLPTTEEAGSATAPQKSEVVAPKGVGTVLVSKKNKFDEEMDSWFSGKSKGKKAKAPTGPKNKGKEKLSLPLDALSSFEKMKLTPPTTVGDVPKSVDELKSKREEFVKLQLEARERKERGEPAVVGKGGNGDVSASGVDNGATGESSRVNGAKGESTMANGGGADAEEPGLFNDLERDFPNSLQTKVPGFPVSKLPKDVKSKLPEDLETKVPEDLETKLPVDLESKLPEDLELKLGKEAAAPSVVA